MLLKRSFIVFVLMIICVCFCSCNGSKEKKTALESKYTLTEVVPVGDYVNEDDKKEDYLRVSEDDTIQLMGFNEAEFVKFYSSAMKENEITEEDFLNWFHNPYNVEVNDGYTENTYKIGLPLMSEEKTVRYMIIYDPAEKIMTYRGDKYKLKEQ